MYAVAAPSVARARIAFRPHLAVRCLMATLAFAPLWWILGFNLFIYHLVGALLLGLLVVEAHLGTARLRVPRPALLILLIGGVYLASILLNAPVYDFGRVAAALNNLSFWFLGAALVVVVASTFDLQAIVRFIGSVALLGVLNLVGICAFLVLAASGVSELSLPTPLSPLNGVLGPSALVEYSVSIRFITEDWVANQSVPRFNLYAPYPTAAGAFFMVSLPLLVAWAALRRRLLAPTTWLLLAGNVLGLALTLARMSIAALVASALAVFILQKRRIGRWGYLAFTVSLFLLPVVLEGGRQIVEAREGSSQSRFELYRESVARMEASDWVLGKGIRESSPEHDMPWGSHSTLLSLLYRTGAIGLALYIALQASVLWRWLALRNLARADPRLFVIWRALGVVALSMALWTITEDLDVPQLLAFLYFVVLGLLEVLRRELVSSGLNGGARSSRRRPHEALEGAR